MNAQEFTYWLNGFIELTGDDIPPSVVQWKIIREHLNLVFKKVTPTVEVPVIDNKVTVTQTPGTSLTQKDWEEMARRIRETQVPATPYEYPPYIDPFKQPPPKTYPDWIFPGYDPTRTIITC